MERLADPLLPVHPFPARMAPELALANARALAPGSVVLDPMVGSGTVVRVASDLGHRALGFDLDPLAILMARVWTTPVDVPDVRTSAKELVAKLREHPLADVSLPWIDGDCETQAYVDYWFAPAQRLVLRRLSAAIRPLAGVVGDALRLALSRIIITKDRGASLARDVSHSRPHRVRRDNDFAVVDEFLRSVNRLAQRLEEQPPRGNSTIALGDARKLASVSSGTVDAVITSPPYLNAIDYMRGHRLALVWLGHRLGELRQIRAGSIGAERGPNADANLALARDLTASWKPLGELPAAERRMVERYALDLHAMVSELHRVLKPSGSAILVVGNSCVRGVFVRNAQIVKDLAQGLGFTLISEAERALPPNRRYLPPPRGTDPSAVERRMRSETVLVFRR